MDQGILITYGLGVAAAGCVLFVAIPYLSGDIKAEKRKQAIQAPRARRGSGDRVVDAANRRKQVSDSLKELDKTKAKKVSLDVRIQQAGLTWSLTTFAVISVVCGLLLGGVAFVVNGGLVATGGAALVGGLGLPRWILNFLRKRRLAKFTHDFPNAIDVVIRGVKAGLPLGDCLRIVATESPEPLKTEFRRMVEAQSMGLTVTEAVERLAERVPVSEASFFAIVIGIQQKAGGNLTEALSNLSRVIRDRKKMRAKVKAISSEAKASAGIIGALPPVVGILVYIVAPDYITVLFTTSTGHIAIAGSLCWMGVGIAIMRKMINFDI